MTVCEQAYRTGLLAWNRPLAAAAWSFAVLFVLAALVLALDARLALPAAIRPAAKGLHGQDRVQLDAVGPAAICPCTLSKKITPVSRRCWTCRRMAESKGDAGYLLLQDGELGGPSRIDAGRADDEALVRGERAPE